MEGIIINLFKDVQQESSDANKSVRSDFPHLVWTNYDRITIKQIKKMEEYFLMAEDRNTWTGSIQSLHLYTVGGGSKTTLKYNNKESGVLIGVKGRPGPAPAFFCIASFKLDYNLKKIIEWGTESGSHDVYVYLRNYISDYISEYCSSNDIHYEIYNSLGAEDIVIVFVSNSIKNFAAVIEGLRTLKYRTEIIDEKTDEEKEDNFFLFETSYSFTGQNNTQNIQAPGLNALVSLTMKDRNSYQKYLAMLKKRNVKELRSFSCFGEYDFRIEIESSVELIMQYQTEGLFSADCTEYSDSIYQSQTTWIYQKEDLKPLTAPANLLSIKTGDIRVLYSISGVKEQFEEYVQRYERLLNKPVISKIPHFKEECAILLSEYKRHMNSTFIRSWWLDLELQFKAFTACLEVFIKDCDTKTDGGISAIEDCIEDIKETYMHISQANRMFFEVSEMMRYYNGSYNNIVRAYYGLIRFLISIGYEIPHDEGSMQSNLAFGVSFDMKPKINSILHLRTSEDMDNRLISFNLPYSALYDIPKYLVYLIHEVFHYITPINRKIRNKLIFRICMDVAMHDILNNFFIDIVNKGNSKNTYKCSEIIIGELMKSHIGDYIAGIIENAIENDQIWDDSFSKSSDDFAKDLEGFFLGTSNKIKVVNLLEDVLRQFFENFTADSTKIKEELLARCNKEYIVDKNNAEREVEHVISKLSAYIRVKSRYLRQKISKDINDRAKEFNSISDGRSIEALVQEIGDGLSEAVCDMYIINILNIPFYEYIESLMSLFDEMSYIKVLLDAKKRDSLILRMGILVDAYGDVKEKTEWFDEQLNIWKKNTLIKDKDAIAKQLSRNYSNYLRCYGGYRGIISKYIHNMDLNVLSERIISVYGEERNTYWRRKIAILRDFYSKYRLYKNDLSRMSGDDSIPKLLDLNLRMIEFFQSQSPIHVQYMSLKKSDIPLDDIKLPSTVSKHIIKIENVISDITQYIEQTSLAIDKLNKNAIDSGLISAGDYYIKMWFRGVCNSVYTLTPSIFRSVQNSISLYAYQAALYKETHARLARYPDWFKNQMTTVVEQIACMQHYGVPTSFLDFSTDFMTSLHFALNPDNPEDLKKVVDAAVYIVHPVLFNAAMMKLHGDSHLKNKCYPIHCSSVLDDKYLEDYIPIDCSDNFVLQKQQEFDGKYAEGLSGRCQELTLPKAIIVPQTNDRIRSQYGTFIAFPLDLIPEKSPPLGKTPYDYFSLEKLQEEYLKTIPNAKPFFEKIVISSSSVAHLRKDLLSLGITKDKMYPELDKLLPTSKDAVNKILNP